MKLFLTITALTTLLLSTSVQATDKTSVRGLKMSRKGGMNKMNRKGGMKMNGGGKRGGVMNRMSETYYSIINAAQEVPGCTSSALGNAIATVEGDQFCIKLSYDGLSGPELFSHVHGPAAIGETAPVIFTMALTTQKTQCFTLTKDNKEAIDNELYYFNIHSDKCPGGEIRGQILAL
jgi:hypothetical protein